MPASKAKRVCVDCRDPSRPVQTNSRCARCASRKRRSDPVWREKDRASSRAWKLKNPEKVKAYEKRYLEEARGRCLVLIAEDCDGRMGRGMSKDGICSRCRKELIAQQREVVCEMWNDGFSLREIAEGLGLSVSVMGVMVVRMRELGYDLPYRHVFDPEKRRMKHQDAIPH